MDGINFSRHVVQFPFTFVGLSIICTLTVEVRASTHRTFENHLAQLPGACDLNWEGTEQGILILDLTTCSTS